MAGWAKAAMPKPAAVSTLASTPVTIAHSPARGCPRPASTAPSATMARAPMAAPRMLATRWLARNWGVVTYLDQPARSVVGEGWWLIVPANSSAAHTGSAHRPSRAARASGPAPGLMDWCVLMVTSLPYRLVRWSARIIGCPFYPGTGASLTSPTSPGRRPAGIGEVTSHIASHPICRGSYGPGLVAAVPGVLLRSFGAGVDSRAVPAKTRRGSE